MRIQKPTTPLIQQTEDHGPGPAAHKPLLTASADAAKQNGLAKTVAQTDAGSAKSPVFAAGMAAPGDANVVNKSLGRTLKKAFRSAKKHFDVVGARRQHDNAYPKILAGRAEVWGMVETLGKSHAGRETDDLQSALRELKDFAERFRDVGDENNMPRVWHGYSNTHANGERTVRPGLIELMQNVFSAAGMGHAEPNNVIRN